jgi:hypothetical protein
MEPNSVGHLRNTQAEDSTMTTSPLRLTRRELLKAAVPATLLMTPGLRRALAADSPAPEKLPPTRVITRGPKHHWFAYYDKLEFDPSGRYVLGMEVDFEHRSPRPDDVIKVGMVDLQDGDKWRELGQSSAWCWQQGCMLQWLPGSSSKILWNDRQDGRYVCHILDVKRGKRRTLPSPVYSVSPDGRWAVTPDFRRIAATRPGYGYNGFPDPCEDQLAPKDSGIFHVNLETGEAKLIVSLADIAKIPFPEAGRAKLSFTPGDLAKSKHWFNHLLINPDGTRVEFLHRWCEPGAKRWGTRMLTVAPDGSDLRILDTCGVTSHFIWRDPSHILAWSLQDPKGGFCLFEDKTGGKIEPVFTAGDGHCTYLPGNEWILCDTYPDRQRNQNVYLYHVSSGRRVPLGHFFQPPEYKGEWRCDTHPRFSPDGRTVIVDAPYASEGRQLHLIDIRQIVD